MRKENGFPVHAAVEQHGIVHESIIEIRVNAANVQFKFVFLQPNLICSMPGLVWFAFFFPSVSLFVVL